MALKLAVFQIKDFYHKDRDMHMFEALGHMQRPVSFCGVFSGQSRMKAGGVWV